MEGLLGSGQVLKRGVDVMRRPLIVALAAWLLAVAAPPGLACVNTFKSNILNYKSTGQAEAIAAEIATLEAAHQKDPSLEHTNDLAVGRILTERHADAIKLLEDAEKRFPGQATVAANLGTAYELMGQDEEALRWISEGVRRDPEEHEGSEWLHVKILEAKLALKRNPRWLEKNTVLGMDFGDGDVPVMPASLPVDESGKPRTPVEIARALTYQLHERTNFVSPPDSIVSDLYAAQGDLAYAAGKPSNYDDYLGLPTDKYEAALAYGPPNPQRVERRKLQFETSYPNMSWMEAAEAKANAAARELPRDPRRPGWPLAVILAVIAVLAGAIFIALRRRVTKP